MKCPTDSATLVMSARNGVEIDYCPDCRGVWLDRGELDKIIDRAEAEFAKSAPAAPVQPVAPPQPQYGDRGNDRGYNDDRNRGYDSRDGYRPKKKENWLGELFG
jgi:Zn-finger nucleic acid-binding protein